MKKHTFHLCCFNKTRKLNFNNNTYVASLIFLELSKTLVTSPLNILEQHSCGVSTRNIMQDLVKNLARFFNVSYNS